MTNPLLLSRKIDLSKDPGKEPIVLTIEGKNIGSLKQFIGVTGLPKVGKGKIIAAMIAAGLTRKEIFNMRLKLPDDRPRIALLSTDENEYDLFKTGQVINQLAGGIGLINLDAYGLRTDDAKDICGLVNDYLTDTKNCSCLIIDNIADLLFNINDETQSKRLVKSLKIWSEKFNILIICVQHLGKGNNTTLGHLGAEMDRFSQSILRVEKNIEKKLFTLSAGFLRHAAEFNPIDFYYDEHSNEWLHAWHKDDEKLKVITRPTPKEYDNQYHRQKLIRLFNSQGIQDYKMLKENISIYYSQTLKWSKDCIQHLLINNIIQRGEKGFFLSDPRASQKLFAK